MIRYMRIVASGLGVLTGLAVGNSALAQKYGGTLRIYSPDSPATMSILEEATSFAVGPMMGVFNNLVLFDQSVKQASLQSIVPDLATSWAWGEDGTRLTFQLRQGVKWHDGQPFTAKDVVCTFDLRLDKGPEKLRVNPGISAFKNLPCHDQRRLRGDLSPEAPAGGVPDAARPGRRGDLSLPCRAGPTSTASSTPS
jgi:peptide/nickel transport system substrate-binding protein